MAVSHKAEQYDPSIKLLSIYQVDLKTCPYKNRQKPVSVYSSLTYKLSNTERNPDVLTRWLDTIGYYSNKKKWALKLGKDICTS